MKLLARADWECEYQDEKVYEWRVYSSSNRESLGSLVATVAASMRSASWEVDDDDGPGFVRVVAATKAGVEDDWQAPSNPVSDLRIDTLTTPAAMPEVVAAAPVESSMTGRVTLEAPPSSDPPAYVQVVEGSDPSTGKVIAEVKVVASGPQGADGAHQVSADFPLEGPPDTDKVITVRTVTSGGKPSPTVSTRTLRTPPLEGFHPVTLALISGATHTGFPAPASTDGHEYDATDGLRARQIPVDYTTMGATWGFFGELAGLFSRQPAGSRYIAEFTVESDEFDLGSLYTFRLGIADTFKRKTAAGFFGSMPFDALTYYPFDPIRDTRVIGTPDGPAWVAREFSTAGTPRQGVRRIRWEYVIGTAPGVAHANSDYRPWTATQWCRGRYGRVRAVIVEPAGLHRVICPSATIVAYLPKVMKVGTGSPEGVDSAPPGSFKHRTDGPPWAYVKQTGIGTTGWEPANVTSWKDPVRLATAGALPAYVRTGNVITFSANGPVTVDGFPAVLNDSVLVKDGAAGADNGIYLVTVAGIGGGGGTPAVWTRREDADSGNELRCGTAVRVTSGTANGQTIWFTTSADPITINASTVTWALMTVTPAGHHASHENGGSDEIDVTGLSGLLADDQTPEIAGLTSLSTLDRAADQVPVSDASASDQPKRVQLRDLAVGVIDRVMAQTKVGPSDAAAHTMYTVSIPANLLGSTKRLRFHASGTIKNNSGVNRTIQVKVTLGGTDLLDQATGNIATSANLRSWEIDLEIQEMNATNAQRGRYAFRISTGAGVTTGEAGGPIDVTASRQATFTGTKDATTILALLLQFTLSASDAQLEAALEEVVLELL